MIVSAYLGRPGRGGLAFSRQSQGQLHPTVLVEAALVGNVQLRHHLLGLIDGPTGEVQHGALLGTLFRGGEVKERVEGEAAEPPQEVRVGERGRPVEAEEGLAVEEERLGHREEGAAVDDGIRAGHAPRRHLAKWAE